MGLPSPLRAVRVRILWSDAGGDWNLNFWHMRRRRLLGFDCRLFLSLFWGRKYHLPSCGIRFGGLSY